MFITRSVDVISFYTEERCILNVNFQYAISLHYYQQNTLSQLLSSIACLRWEWNVNACRPHSKERLPAGAQREVSL